MGGDLNVSLPKVEGLGDAVHGTEWDSRCGLVWDFAAKYMLDWTSTRMSVDDYTHVGKTTGHRRTIDYVMHASSHGHVSHLNCKTGYNLVYDSDHVPILCELVIVGRRRRHRAHTRSSARDLSCVITQNRYQVLMNEENECFNADSTLSSVAALIKKVQNKAIETTKHIKMERNRKPQMQAQIQGELLELELASNNQERRDALRNINNKNKVSCTSALRPTLLKTQCARPDLMSKGKTELSFL